MSFFISISLNLNLAALLSNPCSNWLDVSARIHSTCPAADIAVAISAFEGLCAKVGHALRMLHHVMHCKELMTNKIHSCYSYRSSRLEWSRSGHFCCSCSTCNHLCCRSSSCQCWGRYWKPSHLPDCQCCSICMSCTVCPLRKCFANEYLRVTSFRSTLWLSVRLLQ